MAKTDLEAEDYVDSIHNWMTWKTLLGEVSQILYEAVNIVRGRKDRRASTES